MEDHLEEDLGEYLEMDLEEDLQHLQQHSLIIETVDPDRFEMHRLVQKATRTWLEAQGDLETFQELYMSILAHDFPPCTLENWPSYQRLLPHTLSISGYSPGSQIDDMHYIKVLRSVGWYHEELGAYDKAEIALRTGLKLLEARPELGAEVTLGLKSILARTLYHGRRKYEAAEQTLHEIRQSRTGRDGVSQLQDLHEKLFLWLILHQQGKNDEAKQLQESLLLEREQLAELGNEARTLLLTVLGVIELKQNRLPEAEHFFRCSLNELCANTPANDIARSQAADNLADVLIYSGQCQESETLLREALEIKTRLLGADHIKTLETMETLAKCFKTQAKEGQRQWSDVEDLLHDLLARTQRKLGSEHPMVLRCLKYLAHAACTQKKYEQAKRIHGQALEVSLSAFGETHEYTTASMQDLACTLMEMHQYQEAELHFRRAAGICVAKHGEEHQETLLAHVSLSVCLVFQHKFDEVRGLLERMLKYGIMTAAMDNPILKDEFDVLKKSLEAIAQAGRMSEDSPKSEGEISLRSRGVARLMGPIVPSRPKAPYEQRVRKRKR